MSRPARPILKHNSSSGQTSSGGSSSYSAGSSSYSKEVHFPPRQSLTSTHPMYSASVYDRSPILVSPNSLALPERGCPGQTYVLEEEAYDDDASPPPSPTTSAPDWRKSDRHVPAARVRVEGFDVMGRYKPVDNSNCRPPATHRPPPPPPNISRTPSLVQDLSSEDSEPEFDGFIARISSLSMSVAPRETQQQLQFLPHPLSRQSPSSPRRRSSEERPPSRKPAKEPHVTVRSTGHHHHHHRPPFRSEDNEAECLGGFW